MALTGKQKLFVEHYAATLNATEAARRAGYKGSESTLGVTGFDNLRKPKIKVLVEKRFSEAAMSADECLSRIADQARSDLGKMGKVFAGTNSIAGVLLKAKELGISHLIKKVAETANGISVEFYGAQRALELIGKHHGLFVDKIEHSVHIDYQNMSDEELKELAGRG